MLLFSVSTKDHVVWLRNCDATEFNQFKVNALKTVNFESQAPLFWPSPSLLKLAFINFKNDKSFGEKEKPEYPEKNLSN